jgi:hypothetical protein
VASPAIEAGTRMVDDVVGRARAARAKEADSWP